MLTSTTLTIVRSWAADLALVERGALFRYADLGAGRPTPQPNPGVLLSEVVRKAPPFVMTKFFDFRTTKQGSSERTLTVFPSPTASALANRVSTTNLNTTTPPAPNLQVRERDNPVPAGN